MREQRTLAIMFSDIAGSTRLYERLGDARAREITSKCIELLMRITANYHGRVVKTIGDEVMATFPSAQAAGEAAIKMQEDVEAQGASEGIQLNIRVGFHYGDVIEENGDVFGDAVNLAARMAAQAKATQIITTKETVMHLSPDLQANTRMVDRTTVKGKLEILEIYEITWGEEEELTIMGGGLTQKIAAATAPSAGMKVTFMGTEVLVNEQTPSVSMGRGTTNRFVVADTMASRLHATIEYRRGKFMLVDRSTNGTYVYTRDGKKTFVHRDETPLEGTGIIGVGKEVTPNTPEAVHYTDAT